MHKERPEHPADPVGYDTAWDDFAQAQKELAQHPSVRSLELGWKVSNGELRSKLAIRVYVDRKLPLNQIPPELRIPPTIAGLATDVINVREERFDGHDMIGGDKVTRIFWNEFGSSSGTLGYIATQNTPASEPLMLSNEHVFYSDRGSPAARREVFQPDISQCLGSTCNKVGFVSDGFIGDFSWSADSSTPLPYFIDCAIGQVEDASFSRGVKEIPSVSGDQDISANAVGPGNTPIAVKKMGATTGLTEGVVVSVNSTGRLSVGPFFEIENQSNTILIRATSGKIFEKTFEVDASQKNSIIASFNNSAGPGTVTDLGNNQLRFSVPTFAQRGDSGSVVVTGSGGVAGLLYASVYFYFSAIEDGQVVRKEVPLGESHACHIGPVMARMNVRIDPATSPSAGDEMLAPGVSIGADTPDGLFGEQIEALEQRLGASERGRLLCGLIAEYGREIVDLVHYRRRVMVAWHRHEGPAFAALILNGIRYPDQTIPKTHRGKSFESLLSVMGSVLIGEGSSELAAALERHRIWLLAWLNHSDKIAGLISALELDLALPCAGDNHV